MRNRGVIWGFLVAAGVLASLQLAPRTQAAAATGITVSPFNQSLVIPADNKQFPFVLDVTNNTTYAQALVVRAVDLNGLDESGGLQLSTTAGSTDNPYQLASYLHLDDTNFTLAPGEKRTIHGSVINIADLSAGTHYAALLVGKPTTTDNGSKVPLQSVIASSLLVRKTGGERYGLTLDKVDRADGWWKRLDLTLHFKNTGNIALTPRGVVRVLDPFGHEVARGAINEQSGIILPSASRKYAVSQDYEHPVLLPGIYTYVIQYRYDGKDTFETQKQLLFYIDARSIVIILLGLAVLGGLGYLVWRLLRQRIRRRK